MLSIIFISRKMFKNDQPSFRAPGVHPFIHFNSKLSEKNLEVLYDEKNSPFEPIRQQPLTVTNNNHVKPEWTRDDVCGYIMVNGLDY